MIRKVKNVKVIIGPPNPNIKRIKELDKAFDTCEGKRVYDLLFTQKKAEYAVNRNYNELQKSINFFKNDEKIMSIAERKKFDIFMFEITRLAHNYLSSIFTLIEVTRRFVKNLNNPTFKVEYECRKKDLSNNQCIKFVQDLRNYAQHYQLPILTSKMSLKKADSETNDFLESRGLCLEKTKLLEWNEWSPASKKYIETNGFVAFPDDSDTNRDMNLIDLEKAIGEYQSSISVFTEKLEKRVQSLYQKELNELRKIKLEIDSLLESK